MGQTALRDAYSVPAMLGHGQEGTVRIRATEDGSLCVTDSKRLLQVIKLPLDTARDMEQVAEQPYNEITVNVLDCDVQFNFVDAADESKTISIVRPMAISVAAENLWISNVAADTEGKMLEIWLWG